MHCRRARRRAALLLGRAESPSVRIGRDVFGKNAPTPLRSPMVPGLRRTRVDRASVARLVRLPRRPRCSLDHYRVVARSACCFAAPQRRAADAFFEWAARTNWVERAPRGHPTPSDERGAPPRIDPLPRDHSLRGALVEVPSTRKSIPWIRTGRRVRPRTIWTPRRDRRRPGGPSDRRCFRTNRTGTSSRRSSIVRHPRPRAEQERSFVALCRERARCPGQGSELLTASSRACRCASRIDSSVF